MLTVASRVSSTISDLLRLTSPGAQPFRVTTQQIALIFSIYLSMYIIWHNFARGLHQTIRICDFATPSGLVKVTGVAPTELQEVAPSFNTCHLISAVLG